MPRFRKTGARPLTHRRFLGFRRDSGMNNPMRTMRLRFVINHFGNSAIRGGTSGGNCVLNPSGSQNRSEPQNHFLEDLLPVFR